MAHYDRRILVPYLRDVCTAEMLCAKLEREINECQLQIYSLQDQINKKIVTPTKPDRSSFIDSKESSAGIGCILMAIGNLFLTVYLWKYISFLAIGGFVVSAIIFFGATSGMSSDSKLADKKYKAAVIEYEIKCKENERAIASRPQQQISLERKQHYLSDLKKHLIEAKELKKSLYSANIIAKPYRDIHAAWYLFDYFNTSRETDLDKIVQTLLLDDIRKQLKTIIQQNEAILLNQRVHIALQEKSNRIAAENHRRELEAIARLERNQELQVDYQKMIYQGQLLTNYILTSDYFQKK